jgi:hypothetical protein
MSLLIPGIDPTALSWQARSPSVSHVWFKAIACWRDHWRTPKLSQISNFYRRKNRRMSDVIRRSRRTAHRHCRLRFGFGFNRRPPRDSAHGVFAVSTCSRSKHADLTRKKIRRIFRRQTENMGSKVHKNASLEEKGRCP